MITKSASSLDWLSLIFAILGLTIGSISGILITHTTTPIIIVGIGVGIIIALLAIANAEFGLLALVFMSYTRLSDIAVEFYHLPSTAQPFIFLLVLAVIVRWILYRQQPLGWLHSAILVGLYGLIGFASLFYAADASRAQSATVIYAKDAIIAILVAILLQRGATLRHTIWTLIVAGVFMGTITVFQQLTGTFANNYGGFGQANIQNIVTGVSDYRISGPVGDPNFYAQILLPLVALSLERLWNERSTYLRLLAAWGLAVCALSVIFTFSRGGFLGLVVVLAVMFVRRPPRPIVLLLTLTIAIPLVQLLPERYLDRISTIPQTLPLTGGDVRNEISVRGRASEGIIAWMMFIDNPILGVGLDNYPVYYQDYSRRVGIDPRLENREPHDLYLEVAAQTGILGLAVFSILLWVMFSGMHRAREILERINEFEYSGMIAAFEVGMIGYLTAALFLHNAYPRFFWLLTGIALTMQSIAENEHKRQQETRTNASIDISVVNPQRDQAVA